jgi:hypothetical protein
MHIIDLAYIKFEFLMVVGSLSTECTVKTVDDFEKESLH